MFVEVLIEITSLVCANSKYVSKAKLRQPSNLYRRVHEAAELVYAKKKRDSITSQELGPCNLSQIPNLVLNKGKPAILPRFHCPEVLSSACDKVKLIAEIFSDDSNLNESGNSLPPFSSRTSAPCCTIPTLLYFL